MTSPMAAAAVPAGGGGGLGSGGAGAQSADAAGAGTMPPGVPGGPAAWSEPIPLGVPAAAGEPPGPGYGVTVRVVVAPSVTATGELVAEVTRCGAVLTALDVVDAHTERMTVDVSFDALGPEHMQVVADAIGALGGVEVRSVSDRTFLSHLGGKLSVECRVPVRHRDDLARIYTPGVARVAAAIARRPADADNLTIRRNTVAVVTDGSAVLGLGDLGALAALPVMEGKAALFKRFAGIDAWPVCLDTRDVDEIVRTVEVVAPSYGGINLEDIAAPRCFEVERRLREVLDIPVFHDDQHGTAIVVLAALRNALTVVAKPLGSVRVVVCGVGAAGTAVIGLLLDAGVGDVVAVDRDGALYRGKPGMSEAATWVAERTNAAGYTGSLAGAVRGADVFIGVSAGGALSEEAVASMAPDAVVFALANPRPEIDARVARRHAAVVASGRSDDLNQINNVLVFPGFFRGLLDARSHRVTTAMKLAAAQALADLVPAEQRAPSHIVPSVFDPAVVPAVAQAVAEAAQADR